MMFNGLVMCTDSDSDFTKVSVFVYFGYPFVVLIFNICNVFFLCNLWFFHFQGYPDLVTKETSEYTLFN